MGEQKLKTPEDIAKFRSEILEALGTASIENVKWLQGCLFGLDYPSKEEKKEDGFTE